MKLKIDLSDSDSFLKVVFANSLLDTRSRDTVLTISHDKWRQLGKPVEIEVEFGPVEDNK